MAWVAADTNSRGADAYSGITTGALSAPAQPADAGGFGVGCAEGNQEVRRLLLAVWVAGGKPELAHEEAPGSFAPVGRGIPGVFALEVRARRVVAGVAAVGLG